ncbi:MAG: hypothetical protein R6U59_08195 [Eubacteriales bacterium]
MPYTFDFKQLYKRINRTYLGKPVPTRYKDDFGKIYNKKEILPLTIKIAKTRGIQIDK